MTAISVEAVGVGKRFGAFAALDGVSLRVASGSVAAMSRATKPPSEWPMTCQEV